MHFTNEDIRLSCMQVIQDKINLYSQELQNLQEVAGAETKSSMGDKYETSREMVQQEINKVGQQLSEYTRMHQVVMRLQPATGKVVAGSVALTDQGNFYISVSLGPFRHQDLELVAISPAAPLAKLMMGLKEGDAFSFGPKRYQILRVL